MITLNTLLPPPPQDLHRFTRDLLHQLNEQSSEIANKRRILEKNIKLQHQQTEKESSQAEDLLENQLEVGPTVHLFQSRLG